MTDRPEIAIDVISDVVCPWCFVGEKRLEKAQGLLQDSVGLSIRWRPYQLDPTIPAEGKDRRAYMEQKFGGPDQIRRVHQNIEAAGSLEGIDFRFDAITVSPNTLDAHRLIRWAASAGDGVQQRLVDRLFTAYFIDGRNIGDHAVLLDIAAEAGMDRSIVEPLLKSDADRQAVRDEIATAQRMGVTGVPCFIIDNRYAVVGAQPAETLADAVRQVVAEKAGSRSL